MRSRPRDARSPARCSQFPAGVFRAAGCAAGVASAPRARPARKPERSPRQAPWRTTCIETFFSPKLGRVASATRSHQERAGGPREGGASRETLAARDAAARKENSVQESSGAGEAIVATAPSTVPSAECRSQSRFLFESGAFCSDWACELVAACQISCVIAPCCAHNSSRAKTTCTPALRRLMARLFCQTLLETGYEQVFGQLLADEHQDRLLLVRLGPGLAEVAAHHHVNALEHHPPGVAFHPQDALVAQQVRPVDLDHARQELLELLAVERLLRAEHERLDLVVVLVIDVGEELRVELEDGVEVEAADVEHLRERRVAEVHLLDRRARVHPPQPLDQLFRVFFVG